MRNKLEVTTIRIIRLPDVQALVGLSKATIYRYIKEGSFPKPRKIGSRAVAWATAEIDEWISVKMGESQTT